MATFEPPKKDVSIFDKNNFISKSTLLTQDNSPFIQFPKAQGDVILRNVEANNIQVDGDVLMNSLRTPDKIVNSWVSRSSDNQQWYSVTWSPRLGIFCAVANQNDASSQRVMTSPDGITWTLQNTPNRRWFDVIWAAEANNGNGRFVAVANGGTPNRAMYSDDGITWTLGNTPQDNNWLGLTWSPKNGRFVATAVNGTNRIMYSDDGDNWTGVNITTGEWSCIAWSPELEIYCAISRTLTNNVRTSLNGITWTEEYPASSLDWRDIAWGAECPNGLGGFGLFCVVQDGTTVTNNRVMTSPNGTTWTLQSVPILNDFECRKITWSSELRLFCVVSRSGSQRVATSPDGINWTLHLTPTTNDFRGITWSPELYMFVAVGYSGSNDRVMTTREPSKPLLSNTSKQVESTTQPLTIMSPLSGTTSNIQDQLNNHPYVYDDIQTIQTQPKLLFGVVTSSNSAVVSVVFDPPFDTTPIVQIVINSNTVAVPLVSNRTATGFDFESVNSSGSKLTQTYNWLAIGV
jgi:hypothetical protein